MPCFASNYGMMKGQLAAAMLASYNKNFYTMTWSSDYKTES